MSSAFQQKEAYSFAKAGTASSAKALGAIIRRARSMTALDWVRRVGGSYEDDVSHTNAASRAEEGGKGTVELMLIAENEFANCWLSCDEGLLRLNPNSETSSLEPRVEIDGKD